MHRTVMVWVRTDVDERIAWMVIELNSIGGVRTHTSCQGTIGEGGPHPYRAYVQCSWEFEASLEALKARYIVQPQGNGSWGYVHPRETEGQPDGAFGNCQHVQTDLRQEGTHK